MTDRTWARLGALLLGAAAVLGVEAVIAVKALQRCGASWRDVVARAKFRKAAPAGEAGPS